MDTLNEASFKQSLDWINLKLSELAAYQKEQNGSVARHEKWINQRENELDRMNDRFRMIEEVQDGHQSWIDQRAAGIKEFEEMKIWRGEVDKILTLQAGARAGLRENLQFVATVVTLGVLLLKTLKVIP